MLNFHRCHQTVVVATFKERSAFFKLSERPGLSEIFKGFVLRIMVEAIRICHQGDSKTTMNVFQFVSLRVFPPKLFSKKELSFQYTLARKRKRLFVDHDYVFTPIKNLATSNNSVLLTHYIRWAKNKINFINFKLNSTLNMVFSLC